MAHTENKSVPLREQKWVFTSVPATMNETCRMNHVDSTGALRGKIHKHLDPISKDLKDQISKIKSTHYSSLITDCHQVLNKKLNMKFQSIQADLKANELFIKNCSLRLKRLKRDLKAKKLRAEIWKHEVERHPVRNCTIFQARHQSLSPTSRRIQTERVMLAKMIRGDDDGPDRVLKDEEYREEFDLLCTEVLNELCGDDASEGTREKLLLDIFELSGMAAMTDLNEAYDKVDFTDNDLNSPVRVDDHPGVMNESENVFFDEDSKKLIIFCDERFDETQRNIALQLKW